MWRSLSPAVSSRRQGGAGGEHWSELPAKVAKVGAGQPSPGRKAQPGAIPLRYLLPREAFILTVVPDPNYGSEYQTNHARRDADCPRCQVSSTAFLAVVWLTLSYVDRATAFGGGLAFWTENGTAGIQAEHWARLEPGTKRDSVRITSKALFAGGLFIIDLGLMPWGCGVWPASG